MAAAEANMVALQELGLVVLVVLAAVAQVALLIQPRHAMAEMQLFTVPAVVAARKAKSVGVQMVVVVIPIPVLLVPATKALPIC